MSIGWTLNKVADTLSPTTKKGEDGRLYIELVKDRLFTAALIAAANKAQQEVFFKDSRSRIFGITPEKAAETGELRMSGMGPNYATFYQQEIYDALSGNRDGLLKFFSTVE